MGQYTIRQLSEIIGYSITSIYSYMGTNEETRNFFYKEHRIERTKGNLYDEAALERLKNHFGTRNDVGGAIVENGNEIIPDDSRGGLEDKIEEMDIIITQLRADLERERSEKAILLEQIQELQKQNSHLLLLLSQEKAEKQALLPPPKEHKSMGARIRDFFGKRG